MPNAQFPEYPFTPKSLDLDGLKMSYLDEGPPPEAEAESFVMVHGNPTWSYYYRHLVRGLSDRYRCIVPDHIGMGLSDKPDDSRYPYSLERRIADLDRLIEHAGIKGPINLVVHDWGGMIGTSWAVDHPDRIKRMVILNTGAFHLPASKPLPWQLRLCRTPLLGSLLVRGFNGLVRDALTSCVKRKAFKQEVADALSSPYNSWAKRRSILRFVQDIPLSQSHRSWQRVTETQDKLSVLASIPKIFCFGMKDFVFDEHFLDTWTTYFPDARVYRFEDCGHYILEDAADEVLEHIETMMKTS